MKWLYLAIPALLTAAWFWADLWIPWAAWGLAYWKIRALLDIPPVLSTAITASLAAWTFRKCTPNERGWSRWCVGGSLAVTVVALLAYGLKFVEMDIWGTMPFSAQPLSDASLYHLAWFKDGVPQIWTAEGRDGTDDFFDHPLQLDPLTGNEARPATKVDEDKWWNRRGKAEADREKMARPLYESFFYRCARAWLASSLSEMSSLFSAVPAKPSAEKSSTNALMNAADTVPKREPISHAAELEAPLAIRPPPSVEVAIAPATEPIRRRALLDVPAVSANQSTVVDQHISVLATQPMAIPEVSTEDSITTHAASQQSPFIPMSPRPSVSQVFLSKTSVAPEITLPPPAPIEANANLGQAELEQMGCESRSQDRPEEAVTEFTRALMVGPTVNLLQERAEAYLAVDKPELALADAETAIHMDPSLGNNVGWLDRIRAEIVLGDYHGAIRDASSNFVPFHSHFLYFRARAEECLRKYPEALGDLESFRQVDSSSYLCDYAALEEWDIEVRQHHFEVAQANLRSAYVYSWRHSPDDWVSKLVNFVLGSMTEGDIDAAALDPNPEVQRCHQCEVAYYVACRAAAANDLRGLRSNLEKCMATGKTDFAEYALAKEWLGWMRTSYVSSVP